MILQHHNMVNFEDKQKWLPFIFFYICPPLSLIFQIIYGYIITSIVVWLVTIGKMCFLLFFFLNTTFIIINVFFSIILFYIYVIKLGFMVFKVEIFLFDKWYNRSVSSPNIAFVKKNIKGTHHITSMLMIKKMWYFTKSFIVNPF